ncbi:MAG TPA: hypothetical protein VH502_07035, partial [Actinoplanes sp.]
MRAMKVVTGTIVGTAGLGAAAAGARVLFERRMAAEIDELLADARPAATPRVSAGDLDPLPAPVRRWL